MSVKIDGSGRRSVQVEVDVPGTPEQVWEAIATGPGVSSWFVPTEEREDGTVVSHFGPGMDAVATRTAWEPPHRFAAEGAGFGPDSPPLATEWIVEARSGGRCVVRVVHSLFASTDDWDDQLSSLESGWPAFFAILRLYLSRFPGQRGATIQLVGATTRPVSEAWEALVRPLGFAGAGVGEQRSASADVPLLAGVVEPSASSRHSHQLLIRLDEPTPGIAHLFALSLCGGQVFLIMRFYLYGDAAATAAARDEPLWQAWMAEQFPVQSSVA
jgi:uncharacterized protein YndB with AHSA1/START domain